MLTPAFSTTIGFLLAMMLSCSAQYAWFVRSTDTIAVSGQTDLKDQCTIEAIIMLPSSQHSGGNIFDEWVLAEEEKYLGVSSQSIGAVAYPNSDMEMAERRGLISLDKWHHVAFVCNGVELSSGAIRNHRPDVMKKAFAIAGYSEEELEKRFGGMLRALSSQEAAIESSSTTELPSKPSVIPSQSSWPPFSHQVRDGCSKSMARRSIGLLSAAPRSRVARQPGA